MLRSTDTLQDATSPAGGAVSTGPLNVSQCEQVTVWFIASGAAAPTNCTVSLCDANGAQIVSVAVTVAIGGSTPAFAGEGPAPGVTNAVALGPVPPMIFASGSGGAASTLRILAVGLPRATVQPVYSPTPLIPEDPNTVAHVWWRDGTGLVDTKGNAWTMNGTVPQVAATVTAPGGAGPFSDANWYTSTLPSVGPGDFYVATIFSLSTPPVNYPVPIAALTPDGFYLEGTATFARYNVFNGATNNQWADSTFFPLNRITVACWGRAGTTGIGKFNLRTAVTMALTGTPGAGTPVVNVGRYPAAGFALTGTGFEYLVAKATPSDALFTNIMQVVKSRLRITAW